MARGTWGGGLTDPNLYRVSVRFQLGLQHCQTGFHLRDVAIQDNTPETVANTVVPWVNANFRTILMGVDTLLGVDVLKMGTDEGFTHLFDNVHGTMLVDAAGTLPSYVGVNIAMKTQLRKRYGQGRMFWPVRFEQHTDANDLNAVGITAIQGVLDAFKGLFTGDPVTHDLLLVNAHGTLPPRAAKGSTPARPEIPPSWYDVEVLKLNTLLTSLRSRKVGVGN